jgi:hypothetical protein
MAAIKCLANVAKQYALISFNDRKELLMLTTLILTSLLMFCLLFFARISSRAALPAEPALAKLAKPLRPKVVCQNARVDLLALDACFAQMANKD